MTFALLEPGLFLAAATAASVSLQIHIYGDRWIYRYFGFRTVIRLQVPPLSKLNDGAVRDTSIKFLDDESPAFNKRFDSTRRLIKGIDPLLTATPYSHTGHENIK